MDERSSSRLPVSIITGFLGSGKTTLLSRLVRDPAMSRAAVVINEFGEVGLDHLLVETSDENTILMDSGCLCCTMRSDIVDTLSELDLRRSRGDVLDFDRVVIETTGLADPAPILHTLMTDSKLAGRFRMSGVVTTVDCTLALGQFDRHDEAVKQVAMADLLILTKTDLAPACDVKTILARLETLNGAAEKIASHDPSLRPSMLFELGPYRSDASSGEVLRWLDVPSAADASAHSTARGAGDHVHHRSAYDTLSLRCVEEVRLGTILRFLEQLANDEGEDLLRMKAILNVQESRKPIVVHGVQHIVYPPSQLPGWRDEKPATQIVLIGTRLDKRRIRRRFLDAVSRQ